MRLSEIEPNQVFRGTVYQITMDELAQIGDPAARQHLTQWFVELFKADRPSFGYKAFTAGTMKTATASGVRGIEAETLGHAISQIEDPHVKEFVIHMFADKPVIWAPLGGRQNWLTLCQTGEEPGKTIRQSWNKFKQKFGLVTYNNTEPPEGIDPHLVWSMIEVTTFQNRYHTQRMTSIVPGYHKGVKGYVLCERPWTDADLNAPPYKFG